MRRLHVVLAAPDVRDTRGIGTVLGEALRPGDALALAGDLGAGKTTLVQGLARGLGYEGHVASPTFTLIREYRGRLALQHVDVYRLERIQDVVDLGLDDDPDAVVAVEWGDAVEGLLPTDHLTVDLRVADGETRRIELSASPDGVWSDRWAALRTALAAWEVPA
jgi:tRNA threonylcarbamoyladenosine biosynthesis protein TsaE